MPAFALILLALLAQTPVGQDYPPINPRLTPEVLVVREAGPAVVYIESQRPMAVGLNRFGQVVHQLQGVTGSGVVVEKSGYVITNFHVVGNNARRITVQFDRELDPTVYEAEFVSGVPELHRERQREASLVACAGCNATAAILALRPLYQRDQEAFERGEGAG